MDPEEFDLFPEIYSDDDGFWFFAPRRFFDYDESEVTAYEKTYEAEN